MKTATDIASITDRVLIVDDDFVARDILVAIVSSAYCVSSAGSADEAMGCLSDDCYSVVISDYEMPGGSGLELIRRLELVHPNVITILLTGHADKREVRDADRARRVFAVLHKPCQPSELLRSLRLAVATSHMRQVGNAGAPAKRRAMGDRL